MYNLFLEDCDLLEAVEIMNLLNEEVITEASIAGMKITKENLQDEKFVKNLVKEIDRNSGKIEDTKMLIFTIGIISTITIIGAPIGILLILISKLIKERDDIEQRDLEKLEKCLSKTIDKFESKLKITKDDQKKKELESIINKLKKNKASIFNKDLVANIKKSIDTSKYDDGIKIANVSLPCEVGYLLGLKEPEFLRQLERSKQEFSKAKVSGSYVEDIELLYVNGINTHKDLLKFIDNKTHDSKYIQNVATEYGSKVQSALLNKKICTIVHFHEARIIYSYDDKCCYYWSEEENNNIQKLTVEQVLKASKQSYEDLMKLIKEYDKK